MNKKITIVVSGLGANKSLLIRELAKQGAHSVTGIESISMAPINGIEIVNAQEASDELKIQKMFDNLKAKHSGPHLETIDKFRENVRSMARASPQGYTDIIELLYSAMFRKKIQEQIIEFKSFKGGLGNDADSFESVAKSIKSPKEPFYKFREGGKKRKNNFNRF